MEHRRALNSSGLGAAVMAACNPRMVWQPIVDLATGAVIGHEALARFEAASPAVVFADAAERGLSGDLDALCIAQALRRPPRSGLIFVNVTAATVRSGHFPAIPTALASRVVWELPETGGWDPAMIPPGYTVALDDVGTGFAELGRVTQVPWRFLKLDASLVTGVGTHSTHRALIRALVVRARDCHGAVIAEGIETARDAAVLQDLGVTYGQGFLWGHPQREPSSLLPDWGPGYNVGKTTANVGNTTAKGR
jgi:EAL domain-containing protein (putative c-di-GMP-specific phosphodiesterase class I)